MGGLFTWGVDEECGAADFRSKRRERSFLRSGAIIPPVSSPDSRKVGFVHRGVEGLGKTNSHGRDGFNVWRKSRSAWEWRTGPEMSEVPALKDREERDGDGLHLARLFASDHCGGRPVAGNPAGGMLPGGDTGGTDRGSKPCGAGRWKPDCMTGPPGTGGADPPGPIGR